MSIVSWAIWNKKLEISLEILYKTMVTFTTNIKIIYNNKNRESKLADNKLALQAGPNLPKMLDQVLNAKKLTDLEILAFNEQANQCYQQGTIVKCKYCYVHYHPNHIKKHMKDCYQLFKADPVAFE